MAAQPRTPDPGKPIPYDPTTEPGRPEPEPSLPPGAPSPDPGVPPRIPEGPPPGPGTPTPPMRP